MLNRTQITALAEVEAFLIVPSSAAIFLRKVPIQSVANPV
jgi:hypothetical protein